MVKSATLRLLLSLTVMNQRTIRHVDINHAFFYGDLTEEVFIYQPEGFMDNRDRILCANCTIKSCVTDRNRGTQDMRLYTSIDDGCADCSRRASGVCVWGIQWPYTLWSSGKSTRLSLGILSLVKDLTLKRGLGETLHTLVGNWSRSPDEPKAGRNHSILCHFH